MLHEKADKGEGVQKVNNFADVINGWRLTAPTFWHSFKDVICPKWKSGSREGRRKEGRKVGLCTAADLKSLHIHVHCHCHRWPFFVADSFETDKLALVHGLH